MKLCPALLHNKMLYDALFGAKFRSRLCSHSHLPITVFLETNSTKLPLMMLEQGEGVAE